MSKDLTISPSELRLALETHVHAVRTRGTMESKRTLACLSDRSQSAPPSSSHSNCSLRRCPPATRNPRHLPSVLDVLDIPPMLAAPPIDITFDEDSEWMPSPAKTRLFRTASVGNSWGVTSIGGGYRWSNKQEEQASQGTHKSEDEPVSHGSFIENQSTSVASSKAAGPQGTSFTTSNGSTLKLDTSFPDDNVHVGAITSEPQSSDSVLSRSPLSSSAVSLTSYTTTPENEPSSSRPTMSRASTAPRPRRRSSQQRVSLIAGRLSMVSIDPPPEPDLASPKLHRFGSQSSFLSAASATPPSPSMDRESFLGGRSISEFVIEGELGRGAYGLVKRAREMKDDGQMGVSDMASRCYNCNLTLYMLAAPCNQANYQISNPCRLLEETSKIRDDTDRNLCYVVDFFHFLHFTCETTMGSVSTVHIRRGSRPMDRRQSC